jgi:hypothetical protein
VTVGGALRPGPGPGGATQALKHPPKVGGARCIDGLASRMRSLLAAHVVVAGCTGDQAAPVAQVRPVRDLREGREHSNTLSKVGGGDRRWCASQRRLGVEIEELAGCGTRDHNVSNSTRKFLVQANMLETGVVPRR